MPLFHLLIDHIYVAGLYADCQGWDRIADIVTQISSPLPEATLGPSVHFLYVL